MDSSVIHMVVASEINKKLGRDISRFLIGTIATDISKLVGETKVKSHFSSNNLKDLPNVDRFVKKYKKI